MNNIYIYIICGYIEKFQFKSLSMPNPDVRTEDLRSSSCLIFVGSGRLHSSRSHQYRALKPLLQPEFVIISFISCSHDFLHAAERCVRYCRFSALSRYLIGTGIAFSPKASKTVLVPSAYFGHVTHTNKTKKLRTLKTLNHKLCL